MKNKSVIILCLAAVLAGQMNIASAAQADEGAAMIVDVVVARPACFAATVVGSAFFVVALPFALASKSVNRAAEALVVKPAKATFTRPLGDFDNLNE
jgi:hypothetical protein